jgi:hypothetical protein
MEIEKRRAETGATLIVPPGGIGRGDAITSVRNRIDLNLALQDRIGVIQNPHSRDARYFDFQRGAMATFSAQFLSRFRESACGWCRTT